jgi:carbonic anhydrase
LNALSCIQYAVEVLRVRHIIVCGHYGCGGVQAVLHEKKFGLIDNWLRHVYDVKNQHNRCLSFLQDEEARLDRLCELNVIEQVMNVSRTTIVQDAWERGQKLSLHGWVYSLADGLLRDLGMCADSEASLLECYQKAVAQRGQPA